jgi:hypothetical protein
MNYDSKYKHGHQSEKRVSTVNYSLNIIPSTQGHGSYINGNNDLLNIRMARSNGISPLFM